ncbi:MAG: hypothetical protein WCV73_02035 [Patescibacteria group bacterium]|jgi:hypothetical protein
MQVNSKTSELDEVFGKELGLVHKAIVRGRNLGANKAFWTALADDSIFFGEVMDLYKNRSYFDNDQRKFGWKLLKDNSDLAEFSIDLFKEVVLLQQGESSINGLEMIQRAVKLKANLGQRQAEWLLKNGDKIPIGLRNKILVFPETIWQDIDGFFWVSIIYHNGMIWKMNGRCLNQNFDDIFYLVRLRDLPLAA